MSYQRKDGAWRTSRHTTAPRKRLKITWALTGVACAAFFAPRSAWAVNNDTWTDGAADQTWSNAGAFDWLVNGTPGAYTTGDNVTFDDSPTNSNAFTVTLSGTQSPGSVTVDNSLNNYTFEGGGTITGNTGLTKLGTASLTIDGSGGGYTYTGVTDVEQGTLILNLNTLPYPNQNLINSLSALQLGQATLQINGSTINTSTTSSQTFNGTTLTGGQAVIQVGNSDLSFPFPTTAIVMGTITRDVGSTLDLENTGILSNFTASNANDAGGIIGGYLTYGQNNWVTNPGNGNLTTYSAYTDDSWATNDNTTVTTNDDFSTSGSGLTTNSLRFTSGGTAVTLPGYLNTITSGGILVTTGVTSNVAIAGAGSLTSGNGQDLIVIQNGSGILSIAPTIIDNGDTPISLTKSGVGVLSLTGDNSYSGGTYLNGGTLLVQNSTGSGTGSGAVLVNNGATLGGNGTIAGTVTLSSGATLAPGAAGTGATNLTVGGLTLQSGSKLAYSLDEPNTPGPTGNNDLTTDTGVLNLGTDVTVDVTDSSLAAGKYTLFDYSSLSNNSAGFSGWTADFTTPLSEYEDYSFAVDSADKQVDLVVSVPEPGMLAVIGIGAGLMMLRRRRRASAN